MIIDFLNSDNVLPIHRAIKIYCSIDNKNYDAVVTHYNKYYNSTYKEWIIHIGYAIDAEKSDYTKYCLGCIFSSKKEPNLEALLKTKLIQLGNKDVILKLDDNEWRFERFAHHGDFPQTSI